jgi:hypothetical protein
MCFFASQDPTTPNQQGLIVALLTVALLFIEMQQKNEKKIKLRTYRQ